MAQEAFAMATYIEKKIADIIRRGGNETAKVMIPLIEEAYALGWDDACREIADSAKRASASLAAQPTVTAEALVVRENPFGTSQTNPAEKKPKRAPYGLCGRAIPESFKIAGDGGIDLEMVRETGFRMEGGPKLALSSVRAALIDMVKEGEAERRNGRWFLTRSSETETAGYDHESSPAAPLDHNQGGSHETALASHLPGSADS